MKAEMISRRGWVPRFGSLGDLASPEVQVRPLASEESSEIVVMSDGFGTLQGPLPDCEFSGPSLSQHWAIELQFLGTGNDESTFRFPWLHPQCDAAANRRVGHGHGPTSTRVSKQGLVVMRSGARETTWIQEPKVAELLQACLLDGGFKYSKTSSPGLALERIIEQLGGVHAGSVFQNGGVRKIIEELAGGSSLHAETVRKMIHSSLSLPKDEGQREFNTILGQLVSKKILRQGLFLQCDKCQRHDWYHLSDLGEEFKCKKCFHLQSVPLLDKRPWHYVSDGLFRLEGKVAGCVT